MFSKTLTKVFGSRNQRLLKQYQKRTDEISALEPQMQALSDDELKAKTVEFRKRFNEGESLESLMSEAFATCREAAVRSLGLRHFDVQLIGGMVLHSGKIAEMKTGEGKTLVATLPSYLNTLSSEPVHVVTVNDYLARRDAEWMGQVFAALGLTTGVIQSGQANDEKQAAYACDVVYGTNNEYGFDYLRDNMAFQAEQRVQRGLGFAVVDEVDSILIDEARTPLIISGPAEDSTQVYQAVNQLAKELVLETDEADPKDFTIDEKTKRAPLTETGHEHAEELLLKSGLLQEDDSLYDVHNISLLHHIDGALKAHHLYRRDVDYIVRDGSVVIIDEFTGRMMEGRRWSGGIHQAVEAKEGVEIQKENQTMASITFQNYFRLYTTLSGMTGTADTEAPEFQEIYNLEVVVMPTNREQLRLDQSDLVFRTVAEKFKAIEEEVVSATANGQPVLVGTASIESSELLSDMLTKSGIKHEVLNAKQHEREADIVAEAGRAGSVTIATNMAGRGTDIVLGGNLQAEIDAVGEGADVAQITADWKQRQISVKAAGGLYVMGTERNESRRVDNQLRGRCGRQGDPGKTRFYLSLEDQLMRIFGSEKISSMMQKLGMEEGESIEHPWVTKAIENAQRKVEGHNFDMRKQLLEYDNVANQQRKVVYEQRNVLMDTGDVSNNIDAMIEEVIAETFAQYVKPGSLEEQWDVAGLTEALKEDLALDLPLQQWLDDDDALYEETLRERIEQSYRTVYSQKEEIATPEMMRHIEKSVMLQVLDEQWKDHLANMDHLRQGIGLRGYAQKDPKQEYKREAFAMFEEVLGSIKHQVIGFLAKMGVRSPQEMAALEAEREQAEQETNKPRLDVNSAAQAATNTRKKVETATSAAKITAGAKVGRNEPCPCGSGKKYKKCHGTLD